MGREERPRNRWSPQLAGERAASLESREPVRPEIFLSATDFIRGFADGCHIQEVDVILFSTRYFM